MWNQRFSAPITCLNSSPDLVTLAPGVAVALWPSIQHQPAPSAGQPASQLPSSLPAAQPSSSKLYKSTSININLLTTPASGHRHTPLHLRTLLKASLYIRNHTSWRCSSRWKWFLHLFLISFSSLVKWGLYFASWLIWDLVAVSRLLYDFFLCPSSVHLFEGRILYFGWLGDASCSSGCFLAARQPAERTIASGAPKMHKSSKHINLGGHFGIHLRAPSLQYFYCF